MSGASNRLPVLASEIAGAHRAAREAAGVSLQHAITAGELLIEAKSQVKHGEWLTWLRGNTELSDRTARVYMRLARHKDVVDTKSATVADMTIRGAVAEITEPKWPDKLSDKVKAIRLLPVHGHVRIGVRETSAGWDEVWIAPSYQHMGFFYITHIWTGREGSSACGSRRPVRADYVEAMVLVHMSMNIEGMTWTDRLLSPWSYNLLLFNSPEQYVDSLCHRDDEDLAEARELAQTIAPSDVPVHVKRPVQHTDVMLAPLCDLIWPGGSS